MHEQMNQTIFQLCENALLMKCFQSQGHNLIKVNIRLCVDHFALLHGLFFFSYSHCTQKVHAYAVNFCSSNTENHRKSLFGMPVPCHMCNPFGFNFKVTSDFVNIVYVMIKGGNYFIYL